MKLYITPASPYARMARIVVIEKGLESPSRGHPCTDTSHGQSVLQDQSIGPRALSHP